MHADILLGRPFPKFLPTSAIFLEDIDLLHRIASEYTTHFAACFSEFDNTRLSVVLLKYQINTKEPQAKKKTKVMTLSASWCSQLSRTQHGSHPRCHEISDNQRKGASKVTPERYEIG